jgi:hypothetical protein
MGLCQSGIAATQWVGCLSECQSRSAANRVGKKMLIHQLAMAATVAGDEIWRAGLASVRPGHT